MPTRDSCGNGPPNMDPQNLAQNRPWMLLMPPGSSQCVATARNGELLPEVKYLITVLARSGLWTATAGWFSRQATQPLKNTCCWLGRAQARSAGAAHTSAGQCPASGASGA